MRMDACGLLTPGPYPSPPSDCIGRAAGVRGAATSGDFCQLIHITPRADASYNTDFLHGRATPAPCARPARVAPPCHPRRGVSECGSAGGCATAAVRVG